MRKLLLAAFIVMLSGHAIAVEDMDEESNLTELVNHKPDQGWFWYEDPPVEKKTPEKIPDKIDAQAKPEADSKKPMDVAWLRKMLPKLLDRAEDNPTRENLAAYFYAQRVMLDKSQRFSEESRKFIYSEPLLDENNRTPIAAFGKNEFNGKEFNSKEAALKHLAKDVGGLFVFFDTTCDFCKAQVKVINYMQQSYGFSVKYISMDGKGLPGIPEWIPDNGHAKMLNLKVYPTIVFAVPPSTYLIVSQGMMAKDQLSDRILVAATSNKLLSPEMEKAVNPWDIGVLTVEDMQNGASDNPDEFVKYIKDKLKDRY